MKFDQRLDKISERCVEITGQLNGPSISADDRVRLSKEYAELSPIMAAAGELRRVRDEMAELAKLIADPDSDQDFRELAESEFLALKQDEPKLERRVQLLLLPRDRDDDKNVIVEVRAGTGHRLPPRLVRMVSRSRLIVGVVVGAGRHLGAARGCLATRDG